MLLLDNGVCGTVSLQYFLSLISVPTRTWTKIWERTALPPYLYSLCQSVTAEMPPSDARGQCRSLCSGGGVPCPLTSIKTFHQLLGHQNLLGKVAHPDSSNLTLPAPLFFLFPYSNWAISALTGRTKKPPSPATTFQIQWSLEQHHSSCKLIQRHIRSSCFWPSSSIYPNSMLKAAHPLMIAALGM